MDPLVIVAACLTDRAGLDTGEFTLRPRLRALAEMIPAGAARIADIGYDRGNLIVALGLQRPRLALVGVERQRGAAARLRREQPHHAKALGDRLHLRAGDGLAALSPGEVDGAVIAGIGEASTARIVRAAPAVVASLSWLLLCPPRFGAALGPLLADLGWYAADERLVLDRGRWYQAVLARPGAEPSDDDLAVLYGPRLFERRDPGVLPWLTSVRQALSTARDQGLRSYREQPSKATLATKLSRLDEAIARARAWR